MKSKTKLILILASAALLASCSTATNALNGNGFSPTEGETPTALDGETPPGEGGMPGEGEFPGEGTMPGEGEFPGEGTTPGEGTMPGGGTTPGTYGKGSYTIANSSVSVSTVNSLGSYSGIYIWSGYGTGFSVK